MSWRLASFVGPRSSALLVDLAAPHHLSSPVTMESNDGRLDSKAAAASARRLACEAPIGQVG